MKTWHAPALVLGLLYVCFFGYLDYSRSHLPIRVATHFDAHGQPNGWMSRDSLLRFMTVFGLAFPLLVPGLSYASRLFPDRFQNIPHRDYWFSPARRAETLAFLFRHSLWFASIALCFVMGIHFSIIYANGLEEPHLPTLLVLVLAGGFCAGTVIWGLSMWRHFKHVTQAER